jgi:hypothetical protein
MESSKIIPFRKAKKHTKEAIRMEERTIWDVIQEDKYLMEPIPLKEYLDDSIGLKPANRGTLKQMLQSTEDDE